MTDFLESLPQGITAAPEADRATPALPPIVLALGRGFTLFAWVAIILVNGIDGVFVGWGLGPVLDFLVMALAGFLFVFLFEGIAVLIGKVLNLLLPRIRLGALNAYIQAVPAAMIGRLAGILLMVFGDVLWPESIFKHATLFLPGKFIVIAAGLSGALLFSARVAKRPRARHALAVLAALPIIIVAIWLFYPGTDNYLAKAAPVNPAIPTLDIENPGLPGSYPVGTLSYGSEIGYRRPEFTEDMALTTPVVDGSQLFPGYTGLIGSYYRWYNGFDLSGVPLNGLVWYPEGEGPFPLVLIVHGNHAMTEPSDPGYGYLAEHLASRGMIAVSIDENFLNGFALADGDLEEVPLRAWLLLKHLEQWRGWNATAGNPFYGRVDLERIGLIGHSRGGEAVAHAAEMNARPAAPIAALGNAEDFGFGIRSVVALAPCDNRYKPGGQSLRLNNADYLLLASGHDGDMYYLDGLGQYTRATFAENSGGFKAVAYLYRGNHGNFNTIWGNADKGRFNSLLLNRAPLISAAEQQLAAKVFVTGFLEASLNGHDAYRALFYDTPAARDWLPDDIIVTQYMDADFIAVDTNSQGNREELDVPGGLVEARDMTAWRGVGRTLRDGQTIVLNRGMLLEWAAGSDPAYILDLPEGAAAGWQLTRDHALSFTLATLMDVGTPGQLWVEIESPGAVARLPLDQFGPLHPPLPARLVKANWIGKMPSYEIDMATPYERVGQTYDLPLSAFMAASPDFRPETLSTIRFIFDGTDAGKLVLDEIGFRAP